MALQPQIVWRGAPQAMRAAKPGIWEEGSAAPVIFCFQPLESRWCCLNKPVPKWQLMGQPGSQSEPITRELACWPKH